MLALQSMCKRWLWTSSLCISTLWWSFGFTWFFFSSTFFGTFFGWMEHIPFWCIWCQSLWGGMCCITCGLLTSSRDSWLAKLHSFDLFPANVWVDLQYVFWFGRVFELRYRWVLDPLHEQVRVTLPNIWHSDLGCGGKKKSIHNHSIIRFSRLRGWRNLQSWVEDSVDPADSANSADSAESAEESISESSSIIGINYCVLASAFRRVFDIRCTQVWVCLLLRMQN